MKIVNKKTIEANLRRAIENLFQKQPNLFSFTSATNQTEWNLAHHLANEIGIMFPCLDKDLDPIKPGLGHRRPDIIVHRRGMHAFNFLVVELKLRKGRTATLKDISKIKTYWFAPPLKYHFGATVSLGKTAETAEIEILKNPARRKPFVMPE